MGKKKNATKPLTQEEIWDDSALVRTWEEAVEEYKLYHSIHAKGENVEDVLRQAEAEESEGRISQAEEEQQEQQMETDDVEAPEVVLDQAGQDVLEDTTESYQPPEANPIAEAGTGTGPADATPMPHPVLSSVQDEGLKNLMMSWYYAGYYTGLYEGQQKANASQNANS
ncbi:uncharacterized protein EURHEDRAFT_472133 [Aspergillus ruber CBS 135680]|uniref:Survival Motor Neuron Gemin2-binding domain-containing protein n=1 Tax=Aspergillus ruber (strain CBS 135680) TaxID=1388766 RepID=A0A017SM35_ASPRC|nr:uncharacterized protein EURHEDRAFT_472133 [Aspergillus ruber CBS 135680]EYE97846.1 hypothetical protein EURHEDRAFT_472133 [Aspergillus ruber CBS 135680]